MLRRLLNIASVICLVLCVAFVGMWVRSYHRNERLLGSFAVSRVLSIRSAAGQLYLETYGLGASLVLPWRTTSEQFYIYPQRTWQSYPTHFGFAAHFSWKYPHVILPYWFLVLASGSAAMFCRIRWSLRQFSLRSMFVLTTFLAVVLGMISWLDVAWFGK
jgi:hypothetical protein